MEKKERLLYIRVNNPNGIRIVSEPMKPFEAYIIPRNCMSEASSLKGDKLGVYFLFDNDRKNMYVGQTKNGIGRLQTHDRQEIFSWSVAIIFIFTKKDEWLPIIDDLETYAIVCLKKACEQNSSHYILKNKQKLNENVKKLTKLPYAKEAFDEMLAWLAVFDYNIEPSSTSSNKADSSLIPVVATRGGITANGLFNPNDSSIIVKAGSEIRYDVKANSESVQRKREDFLEANKIKKAKGTYILQEDVKFDKLSPAAEFVIGGSCNGKTEWKYNGKTLKDSFSKL